LVPDSKNPQSLNRYSYCWNNPLKYVDPTGHWGWSSIKKAAKAVAKAVVKNIDYVQAAIDVAGLIPVVGEVFDAANAAIYAARGDYVSAGLSLAACIPVAGMAATAGKLAKNTVKAVDNAQKMKVVAKVGRVGEASAKIVKNTRRIESLTGTATYRVPDILDRMRRVIGEVKNVRKLSYTNQIRDDVLYAKKLNYTFELHVRTDTVLSGPLQAAVDGGNIRLIRDLG